MEHINQCHNVQDEDPSFENMDDDCPQLSERDKYDSDDESDDDDEIVPHNNEIHENAVEANDEYYDYFMFF